MFQISSELRLTRSSSGNESENDCSGSKFPKGTMTWPKDLSAKPERSRTSNKINLKHYSVEIVMKSCCLKTVPVKNSSIHLKITKYGSCLNVVLCI